MGKKLKRLLRELKEPFLLTFLVFPLLFLVLPALVVLFQFREKIGRLFWKILEGMFP